MGLYFHHKLLIALKVINKYIIPIRLIVVGLIIQSHEFKQMSFFSSRVLRTCLCKNLGEKEGWRQRMVCPAAMLCCIHPPIECFYLLFGELYTTLLSVPFWILLNIRFSFLPLIDLYDKIEIFYRTYKYVNTQYAKTYMDFSHHITCFFACCANFSKYLTLKIKKSCFFFLIRLFIPAKEKGRWREERTRGK